MRKGLLVGVCVLCVLAGIAGAVDINPATVRGGNRYDAPSNYNIPGALKKLYEDTAEPAHPEYVYDWNDGDVWFYDNDPYDTYVYMLYRFIKPTGYDTGTLRWKVWAESSNTVYIWRWDNADTWIDVDSGNGNWIHYQTGIDDSWFDGEDSLWFLAEVETTTSDPGVYTDVFDIQY